MENFETQKQFLAQLLDEYINSYPNSSFEDWIIDEYAIDSFYLVREKDQKEICRTKHLTFKSAFKHFATHRQSLSENNAIYLYKGNQILYSKQLKLRRQRARKQRKEE